MYIKAKETRGISNIEEKNKIIAQRAAVEGMVLLENDGALPIKAKRLALFGAGAVKTIKGGTGSGDVNSRDNITIKQGLKDAGIELLCQNWSDEYEKLYKAEHAKWGERLRKKFSITNMAMFLNEHFIYPIGRAVTQKDIENANTDTAIYIIARLSGEGEDLKNEKGEFALSDEEVKSIALLSATFDKFILVLNTGCTIDLSAIEHINGINAILYFSQLGMQGGAAFAEVVMGKTTPSGKLTSTWVKSYSDIPYADEYSYINKNTIDGEYKEGIYVGYRYFDTFDKQPKYPFGYGMSYTKFSLELCNIVQNSTDFKLIVNVKNIGDYKGKEVVQCYAVLPNGKLKKERQRLIAFAKTKELECSETQSLTLNFNFEDLASYDEENASFVLEKGYYGIKVGNCSRNNKLYFAINLSEDVVVTKLKNMCTPQKVIDAMAGIENPELPIDSIEILNLNAGDITTHVINYDDIKHKNVDDSETSREVEKLMSRLTPKDMCKLTVGSSYLNETKFPCFGSVGNTTDRLYKKGIPNVALVDGPAGLRLRQTTVIYKNGKVKPIDYPFEHFNYFPKMLQKIYKGNPNKGKLAYVFTTSFPIGTALAQTWNEELLTEIGYAVSNELKEYGATFWLAPALNIHRNPLCGRNFEYYSEDPLVSGKCAAAITRGVQKIKGNYATIKHFACNNQEYKRTTSSSNLSERALREIYLKGFEIAVKESKPASVMTAYNKLNGVYTPNSKELNTEILRKEWGFDGVVMTDWTSTAKGLASNSDAVNCGNDLIMPGGGSYFRDIYKSYKKGELSHAALERACRNILKSIVESVEYSERKNYLTVLKNQK